MVKQNKTSIDNNKHRFPPCSQIEIVNNDTGEVINHLLPKRVTKDNKDLNIVGGNSLTGGIQRAKNNYSKKFEEMYEKVSKKVQIDKDIDPHKNILDDTNNTDKDKYGSMPITNYIFKTLFTWVGFLVLYILIGFFATKKGSEIDMTKVMWASIFSTIIYISVIYFVEHGK